MLTTRNLNTKQYFQFKLGKKTVRLWISVALFIMLVANSYDRYTTDLQVSGNCLSYEFATKYYKIPYTDILSVPIFQRE